MSNKGTPSEDIERFNHFIDDMDDDELDAYYDTDASGKQRELIDRHISREEVTEEEAISENPQEPQSRELLYKKFVQAFKGLFGGK